MNQVCNSLPALHSASRGNVGSLRIPPPGGESYKKVDTAPTEPHQSAP